MDWGFLFPKLDFSSTGWNFDGLSRDWAGGRFSHGREVFLYSGMQVLYGTEGYMFVMLFLNRRYTFKICFILDHQNGELLQYFQKRKEEGVFPGGLVLSKRTIW